MLPTYPLCGMLSYVTIDMCAWTLVFFLKGYLITFSDSYSLVLKPLDFKACSQFHLMPTLLTSTKSTDIPFQEAVRVWSPHTNDNVQEMPFFGLCSVSKFFGTELKKTE